MSQELSDIHHEIALIKQRNAQVELDKKWERSLTRRLLLIAFTYLAIAIYFYFIDIPRPWLNAVVPALGFLLSTLSLPFFKKLWQQK